MKLRTTIVSPFAAAAALLLAGCANKPPVLVEASVESDPALVAQSPNEIVVLPVEDATPTQNVDTAAVRDAVADALPEKRYAPIAIPHADAVFANAGLKLRGSPVEASSVADLRGALDEDALLGVRITQWDSSRLAATGRLQFAAEVMLTSSATGQPLWWGKVVGDVKAGGESGVVPVNQEDKLRSVREIFGRHLIQELPRRTP